MHNRGSEHLLPCLYTVDSIHLLISSTLFCFSICDIPLGGFRALIRFLLCPPSLPLPSFRQESRTKSLTNEDFARYSLLQRVPLGYPYFHSSLTYPDPIRSLCSTFAGNYCIDPPINERHDGFRYVNTTPGCDWESGLRPPTLPSLERLTVPRWL